MTRTLLGAVAATLLCLALGCGDDAQINAPADIAVPAPFDFSVSGGNCAAGDVQQACGGGCAACLLLGATGLCVTPCQTAQPSCPSGQSCHAIPAGGDGGGFGSVELAGACNGVDGYCS